MAETENNAVVAEQSAQEVAAPETQATDVKQSEAASPTQNEQEKNWRDVRFAMKEQQRKIKELEQEIQSSKQPKQPEDDLGNLADDDIITAKQAKVLARRFAQEAAREAVKLHSASTVEDRVQYKYQDFRTVCTPENIESLKEQYPELAKSLSKNDDPYSQAVAAYEAIKAFGISNREVQQNRQRLAENEAKPKTGGIAKSPLSEAYNFENGLTSEMKSRLWKETQDAARRA